VLEVKSRQGVKGFIAYIKFRLIDTRTHTNHNSLSYNSIFSICEAKHQGLQNRALIIGNLFFLFENKCEINVGHI